MKFKVKPELAQGALADAMAKAIIATLKARGEKKGADGMFPGAEAETKRMGKWLQQFIDKDGRLTVEFDTEFPGGPHIIPRVKTVKTY